MKKLIKINVYAHNNPHTNRWYGIEVVPTKISAFTEKEIMVDGIWFSIHGDKSYIDGIKQLVLENA